MDCLICTKHRGAFAPILQGEFSALSHYPCGADTPKVYRGHLFVEAKTHVSTFAELFEEQAEEMGRLIAKGSRLLKQVLGAEHVYLYTIGHLVDHLHVHLIARYPGTPKEYWGGAKLWEWPEAPFLEGQAVSALSARLREALGPNPVTDRLR